MISDLLIDKLRFGLRPHIVKSALSESIPPKGSANLTYPPEFPNLMRVCKVLSGLLRTEFLCIECGRIAFRDG